MNEDPLPPDPAHPADDHPTAAGTGAAEDHPAADGVPADEQPTAAVGEGRPTAGAAPADDQPTAVVGDSAADDRPTAVRGAGSADEQPTEILGDRAAAGGDGPTRATDGPTEVRPEGAAESATAGLPSGSGFPPPPEGPGAQPGAGFPPGGAGFPSGGAGFGSGGAGFASGGTGFPPGAGTVPPGGTGFPPGGEAFPPGAGTVPPGGTGFPPGAGGFPPGGGAYGPGGPRRLTRSTQRKVIGGVAGGLGEYTGIDPVLFRVLFAVLTLFGGSGLLLYAAGWLLLPADDQPTSPVESLIGRGSRGSSRTRDTAAAAALIAAGLVLAGVVAVGDARDLALCLLVVGGAYFLLRNLRERREGGPPQPAAPEPPPVPYQAFDVPPPVYQPGATATLTAPAPVAPPKPPKRKREHSILGVLTICVLLIAVGVTAALDNGGSHDPDVQTYLAIGTGIIGLGLLIGTFIGRARWLAWLGLPMLALLIVVSTSGIELDGGAGDRAYTPTEASDVQPTYRLGVGSLRIDLSDVDLSEQLVRTKASLGVGNLEIVVPANADVSIDSRSGIGEVLLFGEEANGTSVSRSVVDYGTGGDGRIDLVLDLDVNIGQVRVDRAQA
jgi:phage shock protein PspC (stress-responsive transcriptional regulator)